MSVASRVRSGVLGAAVVLLATLGFASPAAAHDALESSDPVTGSSVEVAPAQITLNFTAELMADGAEAQVFASTDPVAASQANETDWSAGDAIVDGMSLIIPLQDGLPVGTYSVNWRVVSSDGHAISTSSAEVISFTVTKGVPVDAPIETPTAAPSIEPSAPATVTPDVTATDAPSAAEELPGLSPMVIGALVVGGIILLALLYIIIRVTRKP